MSLAATFHVGSDSRIRVLPGAHLVDGRAVIVVVSDGLTILASRWEDMQRLVLALHDGIAEARQAEDAAARAPFSQDGVGAAASTRATHAQSSWAEPWRVRAGSGQDTAGQDGAAQRLTDEIEAADAVAEAEEKLLEAGGLRVRLQRQARVQLRAEGVPLCRTTVILRACALLHAQRHGDDLRAAPTIAATTPTLHATTETAPQTEPAGPMEPAGQTDPTGRGCAAKRAKAADLLGGDSALRDLTIGRFDL